MDVIVLDNESEDTLGDDVEGDKLGISDKDSPNDGVGFVEGL